jgi:hypothetical protein
MNDDQEILDGSQVDTQEAHEPSIQEVMAEKLREIRSRGSEEDNTQTEAKQEKESKAERVRAPDGKFAKADAQKAEPAEAAQQAAPQAQEAAQQTEQQAQAAPAQTVAAPSSYTPEGKAEFSKASPALQREILKREADFHKGVESYKQAANYAQTMYRAIQPYEQTIKSWGVTPDVAVKALFEADRKLTHGTPQEKIQAFASLAKGYGIDLSQGLPEVQPVDPNLQYMLTNQQRLEQELRRVQEQNQQIAAVAAQREQEELNRTIEQAKQNKPHFDELRYEIGTLLQAAIDRGQPITLDQAYEAALWQSPTHRQELLAKQRAELEAEAAKKRAEEAEKAKAARQASSVNVQKRGTLPAQKPVGDIKEFMAEKLKEIRSR